MAGPTYIKYLVDTCVYMNDNKKDILDAEYDEGDWTKWDIS